MNKNQQGSMENLLEGLSRHAEFLNEEDLKAELRARGIDVDRFLAQSRATIAQRLKEARLGWMRVADRKRECIEASEQKFQTWVGKSEGAIRAGFTKFLQNLAEPAIAFRNKTDLTIEDMARILDDHERLQIRAKSQKKEAEQ